MDIPIRTTISIPFTDVLEQLGQRPPAEYGGILQLKGTDRLFVGGGCEKPWGAAGEGDVDMSSLPVNLSVCNLIHDH